MIKKSIVLASIIAMLCTIAPTFAATGDKSTPDYSEAYSAILSLQSSLLEIATQGETIDQMKPISFDTTLGIDANSWFDEVPGYVNMLFASKGEYDLTEQKAKFSFGIKGAMNYTEQERSGDQRIPKDVAVSGDIAMNMIFINKSLYFNIDHLLLGAKNLTEDDSVTEFMAIKDRMLEKFGKKYIHIALDKDTESELSMIIPAFQEAFTHSQTIRTIAKTQPLLTVVGKEGNTYGLVPSKAFCLLLPASDNASRCLKEIKAMRRKVGKVGIISLTINEDKSYSLGVSISASKLASSPSGFKDVKHLFGKKDIITRNTTGIVSVNLPFAKSSKKGLFYANNTLSIVYRDKNMDLRIAGPMTKDMMKLRFTGKDKGRYSSHISTIGTIDAMRDPITHKITASLHADIMQAGIKIFSMKFTTNSLNNNITTTNVVAPMDVIEQADAEKMMEELESESIPGKKAKDTSSMTDLNQLSAALTMYNADNGTYPIHTGFISANFLSGTLSDVYINRIPVPAGSGNSYRYKTIAKNGKAHAGFVLMAKMEYTGTNNNNINFTGTQTDLDNKSYEQIQDMLDDTPSIEGKQQGWYIVLGSDVTEEMTTAEVVEAVANEVQYNDTVYTLSQTEVKSLLKNARIEGNRKADIMIIEYSDPECPYCIKQYKDGTITKVMEAYPNQVGHIVKVVQGVNHPNTEAKSLALICAGKLGGSKKFFSLYDKIMGGSTMESLVTMEQVATFVSDLKIKKSAFDSCVASPTTMDMYAANQTEAQTIGQSGTPGNIILNVKTGKYVAITGAEPAESFIEAVEQVK